MANGQRLKEAKEDLVLGRQTVTVQSLKVSPKGLRGIEREWIRRRPIMLRKDAAEAVRAEVAYAVEPAKTLRECVLELQETDPVTRRIRERLQNRRKETGETQA